MEQKKYQLAVFGAARVDAFLELPENQVESHTDINTHRSVIELSYAAKVPLKRVEFVVGGNGANVAVGTKRLGIESVLISEVGTGVMGDYTKKYLSNEIDTSFVTQGSNIEAGFGAIISYQGERTILSYYPDQEPVLANGLKAEWAYLTSTGENFLNYYEQIYKWLENENVKLIFNPGGRQIKQGILWLKKYLAKTDLLIVNREEAEAIAGLTATFQKEKELITTLCEYGVKRIVITDGTFGSYAFDGEKYFKCGVMPIDAIERTGAGDAYSSGIIASLLAGRSMQESLLWGVVNSASVIGFVGAEKGLLNLEQVHVWLDRAHSSQVKVEEF